MSEEKKPDAKDKDPIITKNGRKIQWDDLKPETIINTINMIYGSTGTGKSTLLLEICNSIRTKIPNVWCIAPSNYSNHFYNSIIPSTNICESGEAENAVPFLNKILKFQKEVTDIYNRIQNIDNLIDIIGGYAASDSDIYKLITGYKVIIDRLKEQMSDSANARMKRYEHNMFMACKKYINEKKKELLNFHKKSPIKLVIISQINMPRPLCLIMLDDVASKFHSWMKYDVLKELWYEGRHYNITLILLAQDQGEIPPKLRTNNMRTFFTSADAAEKFINISSNGCGKTLKKELNDITDAIFKNHIKMCYTKQAKPEEQIKAVLAERRLPQKMGLAKLWEKDEEIKKKKYGLESASSNDLMELIANKTAEKMTKK